MTTGPENSKLRLVVCKCQHCDGGLEFDASDFARGETRTAECPHCHMETIIFAPTSEPPPKPRTTPPVLPSASANACKGTVLDYALQTNTGIISGDDNRRYSFQGSDWMETGKFPVKGMRVDFALNADKATSIYSIPDALNTGRRDCNHVVAGLLGIFLGFIGIHKFYMGYKKEGVILLLCGIVGWVIIIPPLLSAVVGLVEGIIYLSQTQQDFERTYLTGRRAFF